jgi:hypothetical protein
MLNVNVAAPPTCLDSVKECVVVYSLLISLKACHSANLITLPIFFHTILTPIMAVENKKQERDVEESSNTLFDGGFVSLTDSVDVLDI